MINIILNFTKVNTQLKKYANMQNITLSQSKGERIGMG